MKLENIARIMKWRSEATRHAIMATGLTLKEHMILMAMASESLGQSNLCTVDSVEWIKDALGFSGEREELFLNLLKRMEYRGCIRVARDTTGMTGFYVL